MRTERQAHSTADVAEVMATDASWCTLSLFEVRMCWCVCVCVVRRGMFVARRARDTSHVMWATVQIKRD